MADVLPQVLARRRRRGRRRSSTTARTVGSSASSASASRSATFSVDVERVERLGPVEGERDDAIGAVDQQRSVMARSCDVPSPGSVGHEPAMVRQRSTKRSAAGRSRASCRSKKAAAAVPGHGCGQQRRRQLRIAEQERRARRAPAGTGPRTPARRRCARSTAADQRASGRPRTARTRRPIAVRSQARRTSATAPEVPAAWLAVNRSYATPASLAACRPPRRPGARPRCGRRGGRSPGRPGWRRSAAARRGAAGGVEHDEVEPAVPARPAGAVDAGGRLVEPVDGLGGELVARAAGQPHRVAASPAGPSGTSRCARRGRRCPAGPAAGPGRRRVRDPARAQVVAVEVEERRPGLHGALIVTADASHLTTCCHNMAGPVWAGASIRENHLLARQARAVGADGRAWRRRIGDACRARGTARDRRAHWCQRTQEV